MTGGPGRTDSLNMDKENKPTGAPKGRIVWIAAVAVMALLSISSIRAPQLIAEEQADKDAEMRRYFQIMESAYQYIMRNYVDDVDPKTLYEGAMKGMLDSLGDPYSVYLDDALMNSMNDTTEGKFGGVGLSIGKETIPLGSPAGTPSYIEVFSVYEDTPGWRAGFKPGDLIVKIEDESTAPLSIEQAQTKMRGTPGTKLNMTVRRGDGEPFPVTITRAVIEIPTVKNAIIPTKNGNVAYLQILEFTPATYPRVQEAIKSFNSSGYKSMIVDVRSNPGGLLSSVIKVADLFIDKGVIVSTKGRNVYENSVANATASIAVPKDKRVVLLIDGGSASAAEILAGALKDHQRAYLVGQNSYGKGSVQEIIPVEQTGFKLTMARYYTPSDENINKTGIPPDLEVKDVELSGDQLKTGQKLLNDGVITSWAKKHITATKAEQDAYARSLASSYNLPEDILKRLVRQEWYQSSGTTPVYDLELDNILRAGIEVLADPQFEAKLAATKSVKELVEAKKAAEAAKKAAAGSVSAGNADSASGSGSSK